MDLKYTATSARSWMTIFSFVCVIALFGGIWAATAARQSFDANFGSDTEGGVKTSAMLQAFGPWGVMLTIGALGFFLASMASSIDRAPRVLETQKADEPTS